MFSFTPAPAVMPLVSVLASLRLTLVGLGMLAVAATVLYQPDRSASAWLAAPLLLLATNLLAAVVSNRVFRRQVGLLVFHLSLLAVVALAAAGRLTYLDGAAVVTEGAGFDGLLIRDAGPLHHDRLGEVQFTNDGFDIYFLPGPQTDRRVARVSWVDEQGRSRREEITSHRPLVIHGYQFSPTSNKGFAPLLLWTPMQGEPVLAGVNLPSYPAYSSQQAREWLPPGSDRPLWLHLDIDETLIPADRPSTFSLPSEQALVLREGERRLVLQPGESIALPAGVLEYVELRTWMGYKVFYDWTVPWLLASCVVAVSSLAWHFYSKFASNPWDA